MITLYHHSIKLMNFRFPIRVISTSTAGIDRAPRFRRILASVSCLFSINSMRFQYVVPPDVLLFQAYIFLLHSLLWIFQILNFVYNHIHEYIKQSYIYEKKIGTTVDIIIIIISRGLIFLLKKRILICFCIFIRFFSLCRSSF